MVEYEKESVGINRNALSGAGTLLNIFQLRLFATNNVIVICFSLVKIFCVFHLISSYVV